MNTLVLKNRHLALTFAAMAMLCASCINNGLAGGCLTGDTYGFWWGLWHGIIAPIDMIVMLFRDDVTVYAPNNNGAWYAFGFLCGSGGWGFMASRGKRRR